MFDDISKQMMAIYWRSSAQCLMGWSDYFRAWAVDCLGYQPHPYAFNPRISLNDDPVNWWSDFFPAKGVAYAD